MCVYISLPILAVARQRFCTNLWSKGLEVHFERYFLTNFHRLSPSLSSLTLPHSHSLQLQQWGECQDLLVGCTTLHNKHMTSYSNTMYILRDLSATARSWSIQWAGSWEAEGKAGREANSTSVLTYLIDRQGPNTLTPHSMGYNVHQRT